MTNPVVSITSPQVAVSSTNGLVIRIVGPHLNTELERRDAVTLRDHLTAVLDLTPRPDIPTD